MLRYSQFSDFYYQKRQQENSEVCRSVVNGSLDEDFKEEISIVIRRAPSRTWWEQSWQMRRR